MKWPTKPLVEVATLQRGYDLPVQERRAGKVPVFAANGPVGTHELSKATGPGVVTGRSGSIGSVHYVDHDYWPLNTALYVKDFHGNYPRFIFYLLQQLNLKQYGTGTGVPTLNRNIVHKVHVSVPPVSEQRRIVAILDQADALRTDRRQIVAHLDVLSSEIFRATSFDDDGDDALLGDVIMVRSSLVDPTEPAYQSVPHIGPDSIRSGRGEISGWRTIGLDGVTSGKYEFKAGDILYSKIRPNLNKVAIAPFDGLCSADMYAIRVRTDRVTAEFVEFTLRSAEFLAYAERLSNRANIPKLNRRQLESFPLVVPTLSTQETLSTQIRKATDQRLLHNRTLAAEDKLFASLQSRAFRGEL